MKKFFATTKYLWLGGIMGVFHQFLSDLAPIKYQGNEILNFSEIMSGIAIYAAIILLVIKRDAPPKQQFRDLLLFFIGLDFFYYLYIFIIELIAFISYKMNPLDPTLAIEMPFSRSLQEIGDFIYWTTIGLAAAVWALVATKLRNMEKKKLYIVMLIPLFAVIVWQLSIATLGIIMFFITGGVDVTGDVYYSCATLSALTALVSLIVCLYKFLKKPAVMKSNTQEA